MADAKITLYTNHRCPWAHRAHIALAELGIPFEEEIIDLDTPRTPEYLAVNPRGLVPSLRFNDTVLTESAVVAQFLADAYPQAGLVPPSNTVEGALVRARIAFFVDAWFTKVSGPYHKSLFSANEADRRAAADEANAAIVKEIEPLLGAHHGAGKGPFFAGSERLTTAEVLTGPFVLRLLKLSEHGVVEDAATRDLDAKAPNFYKWAQAVAAHPSVNGIFDVEKNVAATKARLAKLRAQ